MKKSKKLLSLLLVLVMALVAMPITALAVETQNSLTAAGGATYDLADSGLLGTSPNQNDSYAINIDATALTEGQSFTVTDSAGYTSRANGAIDVRMSVTGSAGINITVNLSDINLVSRSNYSAFSFAGGAGVTVNGSGAVNFTVNWDVAQHGVYSAGNLTLTGAFGNISGGNSNDSSGIRAAGDITIAGSITGNVTGAGGMFFGSGIRSTAGDITIAPSGSIGGDITAAKYAICSNSGKVTVDGTINGDIISTRTDSVGIDASGDITVNGTIAGDVTAGDCGINSNNGEITIAQSAAIGAITATAGQSIYSNGDLLIAGTINGDITGARTAIQAQSSGKATISGVINGSITGSATYGISGVGGVTVSGTIDGGITGGQYGIYSDNGSIDISSTAVVDGGITGGDSGIRSWSNNVTINGDIGAVTGTALRGISGAVVTIGGNIDGGVTGGIYGIYSYGSMLTISGTIDGSVTGGSGFGLNSNGDMTITSTGAITGRITGGGAHVPIRAAGIFTAEAGARFSAAVVSANGEARISSGGIGSLKTYSSPNYAEKTADIVNVNGGAALYKAAVTAFTGAASVTIDVPAGTGYSAYDYVAYFPSGVNTATVWLPAGTYSASDNTGATGSLEVKTDGTGAMTIGTPPPPPPPSGGTTRSGATVTGGTVSPAPTTTDGTTAVTVKSDDLLKAAGNAVAAAGTSGEAVVEIRFTAPAGSTATLVTLPKTGVTGLADKNVTLVISGGKTKLTFDQKALDAIAGKAVGDVIVSVSQVPESKLTLEQKSAVNGRPVYDFSITSGGVKITDFGGGTVKVTVPYTLAQGENPNAVVVYSLGADGKLQIIENGAYDVATKTVSFATTHFSLYVIGYNLVSFIDVPSTHWGKDSIEKAAARGLVQGVGGKLYKPDSNVTRAEFVQMVVNALKLTEVKTGTASYPDVADKAWYDKAVMSAKSAGLLDKFTGEFKPNEPITREEMAAVLAAVLKQKGIVTGTYAINLKDTYTDYDKISSGYLDDIMVVTVSKMMVGTGGGKFDPLGLTSRAQAAAVQISLLEILSK